MGVGDSPLAKRTGDWLRAASIDADWLNPERATLLARVTGIATLLVMLQMVLGGSGGFDVNGKPIGTDFTSFYAASKLVLSGHVAQVYEIAAHHAAQNAIFGRPIEYAAFFYPPVYLLICWPMALLPYLWSLAVWQGATLLLYLRVARAFAGRDLGWVPLLAFPAVYVTLGHGQNAFLSTALMGAGILLLERRPVLAGMALGALVFKPQLGLIIPFALIAARQWKAFASAGATVVGLALASLAAFGMEAWRGFLSASPVAAMALEQNLIGNHKMQSTFAAMRLLGGSLGPAYAAQAIVTLAVIGLTMAVLWPRSTAEARTTEAVTSTDRQPLDPQMPLIASAALLASPFLLDYDLLLLALPLGWIVRAGLRDGFMPGEKIVCLAAFILPLVSRLLAEELRLPLAPLVLAAVFALLVRRGGVAALLGSTARRYRSWAIRSALARPPH